MSTKCKILMIPYGDHKVDHIEDFINAQLDSISGDIDDKVMLDEHRIAIFYEGTDDSESSSSLKCKILKIPYSNPKSRYAKAIINKQLASISGDIDDMIKLDESRIAVFYEGTDDDSEDSSSSLKCKIVMIPCSGNPAYVEKFISTQLDRIDGEIKDKIMLDGSHIAVFFEGEDEDDEGGDTGDDGGDTGDDGGDTGDDGGDTGDDGGNTGDEQP